MTAEQLDDLLKDRHSTFLYSKRQGELAGKNGEERFNTVFGIEARTVVVLYRTGWGSTPWTRIEETAIRNRAFEAGFDFLLLIPLEEHPSLPQWLPRTRIWFNLNRFGLESAAAVIDAHIQSNGGTVRVETVSDRTARLERALTHEWAREKFLHGSEGVQEATKNYDDLCESIGHWAASDEARSIGITLKRYQRYIVLVGPSSAMKRPVSLSLVWRCPYANVLEDARIVVSHWDGHPEFPGFLLFEKPNCLVTRQYLCDLGPDGHLYWRDDGRQVGRHYSAEAIFTDIIGSYIDLVQANVVRRR